ncbi:MAG: 30S ribosomal protein S6 [Anaerolineales bacterium]|nr:30S ribosomal protein S6 [Anaerolineales bacterium]MCB9127527.1 30S ribosomal protein S6 [Ardenticatenales bacterium]
MEEIRRYELFLVFQPELDEDGQEGLIERIDSTLTSNGGEIIEIVRRGKRRLQYAIEGHNAGIDVIYQSSLPTSLLALLERQFNLNEDIIRYLIVRRDDLQRDERLVASAEEVEAEVAELVAETSEIEEAADAAARGEVYESDDSADDETMDSEGEES